MKADKFKRFFVWFLDAATGWFLSWVIVIIIFHIFNSSIDREFQFLICACAFFVWLIINNLLISYFYKTSIWGFIFKIKFHPNNFSIWNLIVLNSFPIFLPWFWGIITFLLTVFIRSETLFNILSPFTSAFFIIAIFVGTSFAFSKDKITINERLAKITIMEVSEPKKLKEDSVIDDNIIPKSDIFDKHKKNEINVIVNKKDQNGPK